MAWAKIIHHYIATHENEVLIITSKHTLTFADHLSSIIDDLKELTTQVLEDDDEDDNSWWSWIVSIDTMSLGQPEDEAGWKLQQVPRLGRGDHFFREQYQFINSGRYDKLFQ